MDTLNDLLAASDVISLHCALTDETIQIINADCLQHMKPGAFLVNTGSCQLLDDCSIKQFLLDGTLAGCALDGAEGPQWMEAWVREMPNVLILPRSADYSEEVWMEIREKAISILQQFFVDNVIPKNAVSDEEEEEEYEVGYERRLSIDNETSHQGSVCERVTRDIEPHAESSQKKVLNQTKDISSQNQGSVLSQTTSNKSEVKQSRSSKKAKKRHGHHKSEYKTDNITTGKESISYREDDASMSGTDQVLSSSSRSVSPEESRNNRKISIDSKAESPSPLLLKSSMELGKKLGELLKDGHIIALHGSDQPTLHVSRQKVQGGGWFLDTLSNVTKRDPAAQFLVVSRNKDTFGFRSFTAGGKLLQINRRMEFVFASHNFDIWESWTLEGSLEECRLVNCRNPLAVLDVGVEIVAAIGEDGITRWLD